MSQRVEKKPKLLFANVFFSGHAESLSQTDGGIDSLHYFVANVESQIFLAILWYQFQGNTDELKRLLEKARRNQHGLAAFGDMNIDKFEWVSLNAEALYSSFQILFNILNI